MVFAEHTSREYLICITRCNSTHHLFQLILMGAGAALQYAIQHTLAYSMLNIQERMKKQVTSSEDA